MINVIKQPNGNTIQVADGIDAALHELEATLPPGITISTFYDQSQIVHESQNSVVEAIIVGGVLAMLVVVLFLGNLRTASVVLIALPLTVLITFALMKVLGQTLNIMTLGALAVALGLVIDDGIVVIENIYHELESGLSRRAAIASGLALVTPAMIGSSITTMAAFAPLLFLTGITGEFFGPLSLVMLLTLAVSLGLALILVPILAGWLLPDSSHVGRQKRIVRQDSGVLAAWIRPSRERLRARFGLVFESSLDRDRGAVAACIWDLLALWAFANRLFPRI